MPISIATSPRLSGTGMTSLNPLSRASSVLSDDSVSKFTSLVRARDYCGFGNFRVTFISRFFHFRIIREFLNSRASILVVGHLRGLKISSVCTSYERQINVMHRIAAHAVRQLKLEILFVLLSPQRDNHSVCNTY